MLQPYTLRLQAVVLLAFLATVLRAFLIFLLDKVAWFYMRFMHLI